MSEPVLVCLKIRESVYFLSELQNYSENKTNHHVTSIDNFITHFVNQLNLSVKKFFPCNDLEIGVQSGELGKLVWLPVCKRKAEFMGAKSLALENKLNHFKFPKNP